MRLNNVDLNLFLVFDAIYTERNLTRAAERLCITQPAVSNALTRLRNNLGDPLFIRTPKAMVPTPVADNMINMVREALQLLNTSVQMGDHFDPAIADYNFKLSMHDVNEATLLPALLAKMQSVAPNISVSSYPAKRDQLVTELSSGNLDLAIDIPVIDHPDLQHLPMVELPYVCVVRADHPEVSDGLTLEQYLELSHIHISSRRQGTGHVEAALNRIGKQRNIQVRTKHHLVASALVAQTNLAMTVPRSLAKDPNLKMFDLPFEVAPVAWHLYWHRSAEQDKANLWLRETILSLFNQS
ncbi:LysR family transcriptional regulator [Vibrio sp.]|uniref:LysR family transcriptional regulator n=1 Tax=Vibrio sp. TaxID=678 RepID=UPI003D0E0353